jgi:hypothetical protein
LGARGHLILLRGKSIRFALNGTAMALLAALAPG